jgi:hypothetical protein
VGHLQCPSARGHLWERVSILPLEVGGSNHTVDAMSIQLTVLCDRRTPPKCSIRELSVQPIFFNINCAVTGKASGQRHSCWRNSPSSGKLGRGGGRGGSRVHHFDEESIEEGTIYLIHMEQNLLHNKKTKLCERNMLNIFGKKISWESGLAYFETYFSISNLPKWSRASTKGTYDSFGGKKSVCAVSTGITVIFYFLFYHPIFLPLE